MRKGLLAAGMIAIAGVLSLTGCKAKTADTSFAEKDVRVVIGSTSTSGDTYMITETVMRYLGEELGANMKVDAVGAGPAYDALIGAKPDGETVMSFHDMTYLGVLFGAFGEEYALENMVVGPRIGVNPGGCFAAAQDAPYNTMVEAAEYLKANPDKTARVAIEAGSVSHISFAGYYVWVKETYGEDVAKQLKVVTGGSTSEKAQMLWDGNVDIIFGDVSGFKAYIEEGVDEKIKMKLIGLLDEVEGYEDIPTFTDEGITFQGEPFVFDKDFILYFPKDTPQELLDELDAAMEKVSENQEFIDAMKKLTYSAAYLSSEDAKTYIYDKRDTMKTLIETMPSLDELTE